MALLSALEITIALFHAAEIAATIFCGFINYQRKLTQ